ncbi:MAG: extracellular solute-binding protein, partial [Pseudomonadota bacterium]|nr:extracellular solute-binding protein [Pseudomonadota bacterium]
DQEGIGISWQQNLTAADVLVVPKGTKKKEEAMKFLAFATSAKAQADMAALTNYAPINTEAAKLMPANERAMLPDQNTQSQINLDMNYWGAHREEIGQRWYEWQAK